MKAEQSEALIRVPVVIVGWVLMDLWGVVATFVAVIHWLYALATAKRHKGMASFNNTFVAYMYAFVRYALFTTNKRPFPWNEFGKPVEKVDMKKKA
jgi:hypothetical protein